MMGFLYAFFLSCHNLTGHIVRCLVCLSDCLHGVFSLAIGTLSIHLAKHANYDCTIKRHQNDVQTYV